MKSDRLMRNHWYNFACVFLHTFSQQQSINVRLNVLVSLGFFWIGVHQVGGTMSYIFRYWFYSVENWFGFGFSTIFFSTYQKHKLPLKRIDKLEKRMNKLGFRSNCIHIWQLAHFTAHDRRKTLSFFFLQFILQYISCGTQFNWSSLLFGLVTTPCLRCNCVVALFKLNVVWFSILKKNGKKIKLWKKIRNFVWWCSRSVSVFSFALQFAALRCAVKCKLNRLGCARSKKVEFRRRWVFFLLFVGA